LARELKPNLRCIVADALALPFSAEEFSLAFSSGVIEHFDRSVAHQMVTEHRRVTKADDTFAVIVPWKHSPYNLLRILCGKFWPFGYENPFSKKELYKFFMKHPFREIEILSVFGTTLIAIAIKEEDGMKFPL
jgi:ubiquinone/menaquinone biosynthesis C-methylase UbiE